MQHRNGSHMKRKRVIPGMEDFSNVLDHTGEFIPGRLYFITLKTYVAPKSTATVHYFDVDTERCYDSFYNDFGPVNLAILFHYCEKLDGKLSNASLKNKKIVHYANLSEENRVNAAFLIGAYSIIKLNFDPEKAYEILTRGFKQVYLEFRDASIGEAYTVSLLDCLKAVKRALECGFFDFSNFDFHKYEHYERVENGDLNWIVPEKFIAFCGPHQKSFIDGGYPVHSPESYFSYFRKNNVTTIIRLNKKAYDSNRFIQGGFEHNDLFFIDGGIPNKLIVDKFLAICENAKGAIAVHCKAGLGRTGTLIACYIMKHYKFTAKEAIAWIRICRPGSIIAHQQTWLLDKEKEMWAEGNAYRLQKKISAPIKHTVGVYGRPINNNNNKSRSNDNVTGIMKKVDLMEINDKNDDFESEENNITQGDHLNEIKAQRAKVKQPLVTNLADRRSFRSKVIVNATSASSVRVGRLITNTKSTTSSRVLTKRNEMNETQTPRRCSQRKINASLLAVAKNNVPEAKCAPKKKENLSWLLKTVPNDNLAKCSTDKAESTTKRCKRTLALEKDKASPHSVKVLRRSHGQIKKDVKLHLPFVKLNKSI